MRRLNLKLHHLLYALLSVSLLSLSAYAQLGASPKNFKSKADPRVIRAMDQTGLKYDVDKDGDVRLIFNFSDKRSQLIFIRNKTSSIKSVEVRDVLSIGYRSNQPPSREILVAMLEQNTSTKIGAWGLMGSDGKYAGVFIAQIGAEVDADLLKTVLQTVAVTADEFEKKHLSTDKL